MTRRQARCLLRKPGQTRRLFRRPSRAPRALFGPALVLPLALAVLRPEAALARQASAPEPSATAAERPTGGPCDRLGVKGAVLAVVNGRVHTVSGPVLERATVLVRDGVVAGVGTDVVVPPGACVVEARGKVVTPGLLDSHTRLGAVEIDLVEQTADFRTEDDDITAAFDVTDGINPFSTVIPITRVEGVTRAVVVPDPGVSLVAGRGALIDLSGGTLDLIVHRRPSAVYAVLGEAGAELAGGARGAAVLRLREVLQDALDYAANREAFESNRRREYAVSRLDLEALVPVVRGEVPLAVTTDRAGDILIALRLARELRLRLVLLGAAEGWMVAREIAAAGVPVVVNPLQNIPTFERLGTTLENAARLHAAGVTVALASFETHNARKLKQGAGNAVAHGLPHDAALRAVTLAPAEIWGVADRYGSIQPGREADLVVWDGDPFELATRAERVFIRGVEVPPDNRQLELLERYRRVSNPGDAARPSLTSLGASEGDVGEEGAAVSEEGARPDEAPDAPPPGAGAGERGPDRPIPAETPGEEPRPEEVAPAPAEPPAAEEPPADPSAEREPPADPSAEDEPPGDPPAGEEPEEPPR